MICITRPRATLVTVTSRAECQASTHRQVAPGPRPAVPGETAGETEIASALHAAHHPETKPGEIRAFPRGPFPAAARAAMKRFSLSRTSVLWVAFCHPLGLLLAGLLFLATRSVGDFVSSGFLPPVSSPSAGSLPLAAGAHGSLGTPGGA